MKPLEVVLRGRGEGRDDKGVRSGRHGWLQCMWWRFVRGVFSDLRDERVGGGSRGSSRRKVVGSSVGFTTTIRHS